MIAWDAALQMPRASRVSPSDVGKLMPRRIEELSALMPRRPPSWG